MKIIKTRIRSLKNNIPNYLLGIEVIPGVVLNDKKDLDKILSLGFSLKMEVGEMVLPLVIGPVTGFNANGKSVINKIKGKEIKYKEIEWCWQQWTGYKETKRVCDNKLVPYKRWYRDFILPPSIQLVISKKQDDNIYITGKPIYLIKNNETEVVHTVNLFLELFGFCELFDKSYIPLIVESKILNWTILPVGKRPWDEQKQLLSPFLEMVKDKRSKPVYENRLEEINKLGPDFTAIGNYGFRGYVIFGFSSKQIFILESAFYGNAIYIFKEKWEELSRKTKADIISHNLYLDRITHNGKRIDWIDKLKNILK